MDSETGGEGTVVQKAAPVRKSKRRRRSSNIPRAIGAGLATAILSGTVWGGLVFALNIRLGVLAIAVGWSVGMAVRHFGRGRSEVFGLIAILAALLGCATGDILGGCALIAEQADVSIFRVFATFDGKAFAEILHLMFSPMDALFYLLALFASYKSAVITEEF